jgi:hypothetical protein
MNFVKGQTFYLIAVVMETVKYFLGYETADVCQCFEAPFASTALKTGAESSSETSKYFYHM